MICKLNRTATAPQIERDPLAADLDLVLVTLFGDGRHRCEASFGALGLCTERLAEGFQLACVFAGRRENP